MTNLLEQAIKCDDGDRAAKIAAASGRRFKSAQSCGA